MSFKRFKVEKLLRDHMSEKMRALGIIVHDKTMDQEEFIYRLKEKLLEEAEEVKNTHKREELIDELADVLEIIHSLSNEIGLSLNQLEERRLKKQKSNGGFNRKIYGFCVDIEESNPEIQYFLKRPIQYPEQSLKVSTQADVAECVLSQKRYKCIDLTHPLSPKIPTWDGSCGFQHTNIINYDDCSTECKFLVQRIDMLAGLGTHMDAPAHCFSQGKTISEISLPSLIIPCVVINVSAKANEHYSVDMQAIEEFENEHGKICKDTLVIFYTGWDRFWNDPERYHNQHHFPSISKQVAEYLISKDIVGIGIDTLSPDRPEDGFPVHQVILGSDKYIIENIADASLMPSVGGYCLVMPMKTSGTEAPIRLVGMLPINASY